MKLPTFKTKNIWIGNIMYFENKIGQVTPNKYLIVKTKKNYRIITEMRIY